MKWVILNHKGKPIAKSSDRDHLFHLMAILGICPYTAPIARVKE